MKKCTNKNEQLVDQRNTENENIIKKITTITLFP